MRKGLLKEALLESIGPVGKFIIKGIGIFIFIMLPIYGAAWFSDIEGKISNSSNNESVEKSSEQLEKEYCRLRTDTYQVCKWNSWKDKCECSIRVTLH